VDAGFRWVDASFRRHDETPVVPAEAGTRAFLSSAGCRFSCPQLDAGFRWVDAGIRRHDETPVVPAEAGTQVFFSPA